jgi:hypothetical protein
MEYTQTSFNRLMGPTAQISAGGGGAKILGSSGGNSDIVNIRRKALEERRLAEELDPMLREERLAREAYAGLIRGRREGMAKRNKAMAESSWGQMTGRSPVPIKSPGSGPWSYSSF